MSFPLRAAAVDPVCGRVVRISRAAGFGTFAGHEHYFCSDECGHRFTQDPQRYAGRARTTHDPVGLMTSTKGTR